jgi:hypothetical protein
VISDSSVPVRDHREVPCEDGGETPARAWQRKGLWLTVCAALVLVLWALQVTPYLNPANDAGRYMVLGESLAQTGDLRLLNDVHRPLDTLYPPGFPAIIAFWMLVTGRAPGGVVVLVKFTQVLLLIGTLPLLAWLLERARLSSPYIAAALLTAALCPALISYANEVMSEIPMVFLCLASIVLVERMARTLQDREPDKDSAEPMPPAWQRGLALLCAAGAYLVRSAAIALLLAQVVWFWRRFGWRWGVAALVVMLLVAGGWQRRNQHIVRSHPKGHYQSYLDQFTLRDPMNPNAGRIPLNAIGLLGRARRGVPAYIGMIPRAMLNSMSTGTPWIGLFYLVAVPMTLLILYGFMLGWQRGLTLSGGFSAFFWFCSAMWPWRDARFLVPLVPFFLLYLFLAVETISHWLESTVGAREARLLQGACALPLLIYFAHVHVRAILQERKVTAPGYALGRNREEGGFYAACAWLQQNGTSGAVVMGRPAYLLHLYSGHPTTQIEPNDHPRVQERAYIQPNHVGYIVQDAWWWAKSDRYLGPYLHAYADRWQLVWQDPRGSGVRVWQRVSMPLAPSSSFGRLNPTAIGRFAPATHLRGRIGLPAQVSQGGGTSVRSSDPCS